MACIVQKARQVCHDVTARPEVRAFHCRLWRRHERVAHAAKQHVLAPDVACGSQACDSAYLILIAGPVEGECGIAIIGGDSTGWMGEDNTWNPTLYNTAGSGAYGLPQAMGSMASAGPDWRTSPRTQERWLVAYSKGRYGSVCAALAHEHEVGWY